MEAIVWIAAAAFAGMGVAGLLKPQFVMDYFGVSLTKDGRNEVRAVYGGFGLAIGGALIWATQNGRYGAGIIFTVAVALAGMATGRAISAAIERPGKWPIVFFVMEAVGVTALFLSIPKGAGFNWDF